MDIAMHVAERWETREKEGKSKPELVIVWGEGGISGKKKLVGKIFEQFVLGCGQDNGHKFCVIMYHTLHALVPQPTSLSFCFSQDI